MDRRTSDGQRRTASDHNSSLSTPYSGELKNFQKGHMQCAVLPVMYRMMLITPPVTAKGYGDMMAPITRGMLNVKEMCPNLQQH